MILTSCGRRSALSVTSKQLIPTPTPIYSPTPTPTMTLVPTPTPTPTTVPTWIPAPPLPTATPTPVVVVPAPSIPALKCTLEAAAAPRADMSLPMGIKCNLPLQSIKLNNKNIALNAEMILMPTGNQYIAVAEVVSVDGQKLSTGFTDTVPFYCNLEVVEVKLADGARNGRVVIRMHQNAQAGTTLSVNQVNIASPGPGDVDFPFTGLAQGGVDFSGRFGGTTCANNAHVEVPGNYFELYAMNASRVFQNETPDKAVDGDTTTYWGSGDYTGSITLCFRDGIVTPSRIAIRWSQSPADYRSRKFEFSHAVSEDFANRTKFDKTDNTANESITWIEWDRTKPVKCFKIDQRDRFVSWMGIREVIAYR